MRDLFLVCECVRVCYILCVWGVHAFACVCMHTCVCGLHMRLYISLPCMCVVARVCVVCRTLVSFCVCRNV